MQLALWLLTKANAADKFGFLELTPFTCSAPHLNQTPFNSGKAEDASHLAAVVSSPGTGRGAPPACIGSLLSRLHYQVCFKVMFYTFAKIKIARSSKLLFFILSIHMHDPYCSRSYLDGQNRPRVSQRKKASHRKGEAGQKTEKLG